MKYSIGVLLLFVGLFTGCATQAPFMSLNKNQLALTMNGKELSKPLKNASLQYYPGFCVNEALSVKSQDIFLEKIHLDSNCNWNGLARGFFTSLFKDKLKLKTLTMIENIDVKNYELSMFKINDSSYVGLIYRYGVFNDVFIWDFEGSFYEKVLAELTHKPLREIQQPRFKTNYNHALTRYNFFNHYYGRSSENRLMK